MDEKLLPEIDLTGYCKEKYLVRMGNYEIKEINGQTYAVRRKFPKTFEECWEVLGLTVDSILDTTVENGTKMYGSELWGLYKLLICRDAYWKLCGNWKPDWKNMYQDRWIIYVSCGNVYKSEIKKEQCNFILVFPTEEARDIFYDNFKSDIEYIKELL